jgi:exodeoxyribonuclease-3
MQIATWNVNSLRVRLAQVLAWLEERGPDVLALQETKLADEQFTRGEVEAAGYQVVYSGQKTYNGVAILSRQPPREVATDIPGLDDPQRRILVATIAGIRVINLYVVNGSEVGSEKFAYKLHWLEKVTDYVHGQMAQYPDTVVLGDFNIAPEDRDVYDPELWHERILCSTPEREALRRLLDLGLVDTFRLFEQEPGAFSWWDYRAAAFRRNAGLRIDLILASRDLARRCVVCEIDKEPRRLERPSDHTPVIVSFQ